VWTGATGVEQSVLGDAIARRGVSMTAFEPQEDTLNVQFDIISKSKHC